VVERVIPRYGREMLLFLVRNVRESSHSICLLLFPSLFDSGLPEGKAKGELVLGFSGLKLQVVLGQFLSPLYVTIYLYTIHSV
jgi:hypothetical protein